jgi:hypothetical protein
MPTLTRLAFLTSILFATVSSTQADDTKPVELLPGWKKGDKFKYDVRKSQLREANGKVVRKVGVKFPVEVEVIESGAKGHVMRWTQGETTFDDPKVAENPLVKAMMKLTNGMVLELEVDSDGELHGIRNWKDLQATGGKVLDVFFADLAKANLPKATLDTLRTETEKMLASKDAVSLSFGRDAGLLFLALGQTYESTKPTQVDGMLPNPFGGDPFPAKLELSLKKLDTTQGVAHVVIKQSPDPKELNRVLEKTMRDLAKKLGKPVGDKVVLPELTIQDVAEVAIEVKSGWVRSVTQTRKVTTGTTTQTDTTTLTRRDK